MSSIFQIRDYNFSPHVKKSLTILYEDYCKTRLNFYIIDLLGILVLILKNLDMVGAI